MCFCAAWSRKSRWTTLNYSRRIKTANTSPHWPALCKLQNTRLFLKLCAKPLVCWSLPPRFSNWLTPLFSFTVIHKYHPQHWERDGTPAQSGCDSGLFFFFGLSLLMFYSHTHNTTTHTKTTKALPTMTKPIWMDNGATMTSGLSAFSVITSTSRGQMYERRPGRSVFRYTATLYVNPVRC